MEDFEIERSNCFDDLEDDIMGVEEEFDERHFNKSDSEIRNMKQEVEEIIESYKALRAKTEAQHRTIVGLTTDKEDARQRLRSLINRRVAGEGPDYDAYQIQRKISKQYDTTRPSSLKKVAVTITSPTADESPVNVEVKTVDDSDSEA